MDERRETMFNPAYTVATAEKVSIKVERFEELVTKENEYGLLIDCLLNCARLSYNEKSLAFSDEAISSLMSLIVPDYYSNKLKKLIEEKENEHE